MRKNCALVFIFSLFWLGEPCICAFSTPQINDQALGCDNQARKEKSDNDQKTGGEDTDTITTSLQKLKKLAFYVSLIGGTLLIIYCGKHLFSPSPDDTPPDGHTHRIATENRTSTSSYFVNNFTQPFEKRAFSERARKLLVTNGNSVDNRAYMALLHGTIAYSPTYEKQKELYRTTRALLPDKNQQKLFDDLLYEQLLGKPRGSIKELAAFSPLDIYTIARTLLEKSYQLKENFTDNNLLDAANDAIKSYLTNITLELTIDTQALRAPVIQAMNDLKAKPGFESQEKYATRLLLAEIITEMNTSYKTGDGIIRIPYQIRKKIFEQALSHAERQSMLSLLPSMLSSLSHNDEEGHYLTLLISADCNTPGYVIERIAFCLERLYNESTVEDMEKPFTKEMVVDGMDKGLYGDYDTLLPSLQAGFNKACAYLHIPPEGIHNINKSIEEDKTMRALTPAHEKDYKQTVRKKKAWFNGVQKLFTQGTL